MSNIVEQIDNAATQATAHMRAHGIRLKQASVDVPLQDEIDRYLRQLVTEAYLSFQATKDEARSEGHAPADYEIEGYYGDDRLFEVSLTGLVGFPGFLTARISLRLT